MCVSTHEHTSRHGRKHILAALPEGRGIFFPVSTAYTTMVIRQAAVFPSCFLSYVSLCAELKTELHLSIFKIWPIGLETGTLELYHPLAPSSHTKPELDNAQDKFYGWLDPTAQPPKTKGGGVPLSRAVRPGRRSRDDSSKLCVTHPPSLLPWKLSNESELLVTLFTS